MKRYPYVAQSQSDPNGDNGGLGFISETAANTHAERMNDLREEYPAGWNTNFWASKPEAWRVVKNN